MASRQQERWPLWFELLLLGGAVVLASRLDLPTQRRPATAPASADEGAFERRPSQEPQHLQDARAAQPGRGRNAAAPSKIPVRGWKDILWRTYNQIGEDRLLAVGAGAVFYLLLAMFPAITAFVSNFADYGATYGSLGAAIGLMMWLWLSVIVILVGAELNAEIEHQTARDTTTGGEKPLGTRGAVIADTLGESWR